ncbi:arylsulfatase A-like enzyme [Neorhizobium galegae]|uniref:arylsulfatase B n=1 Tax=Neorhizobium galegae TaxID=399 RepID=UPI001FD8FB1C|nr:arylsulfatase [Neorhizobium galegae]MBP2551749.1 arylsulfatase A-like enzyme [Neorhizobium galegae]
MTRRQTLLSGAALAISRLAIGGAAPASALATLGIGTQAEAKPTEKPPHIIYVVADDLGWKDVGYHGSDIRTPHIDALAANGARLEQFYAQPMCTPTRAALMTGRYPLRYGLQTGVIPSGGSYGLATDEYILPQMLKDAGYRTAMVGKWHLGHAKKEFWPTQRGFESFYGALVGEIDHFEHASHGVKDWYRDNEPLQEEGVDNLLFSKEALKIVDTHDANKPLFLYLAYTAPHTPLQAPQEYLDKYSAIPDPQRRAYAAMISIIDDGIGALVETLAKRGMRENTIIMFQSDNGGVRSAMFAGESKVTGELPAQNGPYRDGKGTLYEGGTRVAALANWPGKIASEKVDGVIHVTDIYPTLAALAGVELGRNKPLDGINAWATISQGKPSARHEMVYNVDPMGGAIRDGNMKLIWTAALPGRVELFDLSKDKSETTNLAERYPRIVRKLQERIRELSAQMAPPLLLGEAIKLTFGAPPKSWDPAAVFDADN